MKIKGTFWVGIVILTIGLIGAIHYQIKGSMIYERPIIVRGVYVFTLLFVMPGVLFVLYGIGKKVKPIDWLKERLRDHARDELCVNLKALYIQAQISNRGRPEEDFTFSRRFLGDGKT